MFVPGKTKLVYTRQPCHMSIKRPVEDMCDPPLTADGIDLDSGHVEGREESQLNALARRNLITIESFA